METITISKEEYDKLINQYNRYLKYNESSKLSMRNSYEKIKEKRKNKKLEEEMKNPKIPKEEFEKNPLRYQSSFGSNRRHYKEIDTIMIKGVESVIECRKTYRIKKYLNKGEFIYICNELSREFELAFGKKFVFKPEDKTEIAIQLETEVGYKSLRFQGTIQIFNIKGDELETWKDSEEIIMNSKIRSDFFIKSLEGAPNWNNKEMDIVYYVLSNNGFDFFEHA